MKKIVFVVCLLFVVSVCAVSFTETNHVHSYDWGNYHYNEQSHWMVCWECGEKLYVAPHQFEDGVCTVCGFEFTPTTPTIAPSATPEVTPTVAPTEEATQGPSDAPEVTPTVAPTDEATLEPTDAPEVTPTVAPTDEATLEPTQAPEVTPTIAPTDEATLEPTQAPEVTPTIAPTEEATQEPTQAPKVTPAPTEAPAQPPRYLIEGFSYDGAYINGKLTHVEGTAESETLYIRVTLFLRDGSTSIFMGLVDEDGSFELGASGNIAHVTIVVTGTLRAIRPDGSWTSFGAQEF